MKLGRLDGNRWQALLAELKMPLEKPDNKDVKLIVHIPGGSQVIERNAKTFEEAVNDCADAMKEKLTRHKERKNE